MNGNWIVDVVLLLGLVFLALFAFQLSRHATSIDDEELKDVSDESGKKSFSLYPRKLIRQAGYIPDKVTLVYWFGKLLLAFLFPLTFVELGAGLPIMVYIFLGIFALFVPDIWLWQRKLKRQYRIDYALSYFLDLTIAFLLSGMNLDAAIRQATTYGLPPRNPLRQELSLVQREIDAGRNRDEAYGSLWSRTGVKSLPSLINIFKVGFRIGSPVVENLEEHADLLRARVREQGFKRINRKTIIGMVPLILLNFPIMAILVFFPPFVEIGRIFPSFAF